MRLIEGKAGELVPAEPNPSLTCSIKRDEVPTSEVEAAQDPAAIVKLFRKYIKLPPLPPKLIVRGAARSDELEIEDVCAGDDLSIEYWVPLSGASDSLLELSCKVDKDKQGEAIAVIKAFMAKLELKVLAGDATKTKVAYGWPPSPAHE